MKNKLLLALTAAAVVVGSASATLAADPVALSPRASVEIGDDGYLRGITEPVKASFIAAQFDSEVTVKASGADTAYGDSEYVASESTVYSGDSEVARVIVAGDANCDGRIGLGDVIAVLKRVAGWDSRISERSADVVENGEIDLADAVAILEYACDWNIELGEPVMLSVFDKGKTEYKLLANDPATDSEIVSAIEKLTGIAPELVGEAGDGDRFITVGKRLDEKYDFIDGDAVSLLEDTQAYIDTYGGNIYLTAASDNGLLGCINYITSQAFTPELDMEIKKGTVETLGDLETLIHPTFTRLEIEGISNPYRFLHVTDSHLTTVYEDEETPERRANVGSRLNDWMLKQYRKPSYLYFNEYFNYAEGIYADGIMLTGDITDSPSQSNRDILETAIRSCSVPSWYIYGNHDWTWNTNEATGDRYQDISFRHKYKDGFKKAADAYDEDWNQYGNIIEYEDLMLASVDNGAYAFERGGFAVLKEAVDRAKETSKPLILMLHIPFHTDDMHENVDRITDDSGYCLKSLGDNSFTDRAYKMVTAEDSPVAAIFCGHIHYSYETLLEGRIPEIVTGAALEGNCRVVDIVPAE